MSVCCFNYLSLNYQLNIWVWRPGVSAWSDHGFRIQMVRWYHTRNCTARDSVLLSHVTRISLIISGVIIHKYVLSIIMSISPEITIFSVWLLTGYLLFQLGLRDSIIFVTVWSLIKVFQCRRCLSIVQVGYISTQTCENFSHKSVILLCEPYKWLWLSHSLLCDVVIASHPLTRLTVTWY